MVPHRSRAWLLSLWLVAPGCAGDEQPPGDPMTLPDDPPPPPFEPNTPAVYTAKVKNLLTGAPVTDAEVSAVRPVMDEPNVTLLVETKAERLLTDPTGGDVTGVEVILDGESVVFTADVFVVSCGSINSAVLLYLRATLLRLCFLVEVASDLALLISPAWGCVCQSRLEIGAIWRLCINIQNVTRAARACCERRSVQPSRGFWKMLPSSR